MGKVLRVQAINPVKGLLAEPEVISFSYVPCDLFVQVQQGDAKRRVEFRFYDVEAFWTMDEGRFLEYWPACSSPGGNLFEVTSGGTARSRLSGALTAIADRPDLREFFVPGANACVLVLAWSLPESHECHL